jgi:hypothetical protein
MKEIVLKSNVKYITSGVIPKLEDLPEGHIAFGYIIEDNRYHIYGNTIGEIEDLCCQPGSDNNLIQITDGVIPNKIQPVKGRKPYTLLTNEEWTGFIEWQPKLTYNSFSPETEYTAIITIIPKRGYTLEGIGDIFTIDVPGADLTYFSNQNVISFPET